MALYGACTSQRSCCAQGECYKQSEWYWQCLPSGQCPSYWPCDTRGAALSNAAARASNEGGVSAAVIAGVLAGVAALGAAGVCAAKTLKKRPATGDDALFGDDDPTPSPTGGAGMSLAKGEFAEVAATADI